MPPSKSLPRPHRVHLRIGAPLSFKAKSCDRAGWNQVAGDVEAAVRALGEP